MNELASLLALEGRVALVTGGSGGIGHAVVRVLQQAGATVYSLDRTLEGAPEGARALAGDVADASAVRAALDRVEVAHGRLDLLVHCAGITRDRILWKMSFEEWSAVIATNLDSAFFLLHGAAPLLRVAGGGAVVLVASINGERGKAGQANYAASKAGLIALAKTAARELGRFGVRVNAVAPGLIDTAMTRGLPSEWRQQAESESALGRAGRPEHVAHAILFLCSELSAHITGQVLRVDGGQLMA